MPKTTHSNKIHIKTSIYESEEEEEIAQELLPDRLSMDVLE